MTKDKQIKGMANPNRSSVGVQEAQPKQEPVALVLDGVLVKSAIPGKFTGHLYTTPPQRTWVGLTNNELQPIADEYRILFGSWVEDFARAIEAKLRSKNEHL
jgi:hypothetical protein